jgi:hypothetical protein
MIDFIERLKEQTGIKIGMSKEEAFEKFRFWREKMKTCQRCEDKDLFQYCPFHLICEEADYVRNVEGNDNRSRIDEIDGSKALRTALSENRKRASVR